MSDDELVRQIQLGDTSAAEELIQRYYSLILRYCRWHCSSLEKAEDLTQEFGYYPGYTAVDFLLYIAALKGIPRNIAKKRVAELLEIVGLETVAVN